jgi:hypothetical protein
LSETLLMDLRPFVKEIFWEGEKLVEVLAKAY